jgi:hypothetical protein
MSQDREQISKPVILDVGRQKRRAIDDLKQGVGPLADEVRQAVQTAIPGSGKGEKEIVPVVVLYRKRDRKRGLLAEILRSL